MLFDCDVPGDEGEPDSEHIANVLIVGEYGDGGVILCDLLEIYVVVYNSFFLGLCAEDENVQKMEIVRFQSVFYLFLRDTCLSFLEFELQLFDE